MSEENKLPKTETPTPVAAAASGSLAPSFPDSKAAFRWADLIDGIKKLALGETVELHHPKDQHCPTNSGVCLIKNDEGRVMRVYAALWTVLGDTQIWTYQCMGFSDPENDQAEQPEASR